MTIIISRIRENISDWTATHLTKKNILLSIIFPVRIFKPVSWCCLPMLCMIGVLGVYGMRNGISPRCLPFTWGLRIIYDHALIPIFFTAGKIGCSLLCSRSLIVQIISMWYTAQLAIIVLELMAFYMSTFFSSIILIVNYYMFKRIFPAIFRWIWEK